MFNCFTVATEKYIKDFLLLQNNIYAFVISQMGNAADVGKAVDRWTELATSGNVTPTPVKGLFS